LTAKISFLGLFHSFIKKMSDVASILGMGSQPLTHANALLDEASKILNDKPKGLNAGPRNVKKPKGMSREVFSLLGADGFVPTMQGNKQTTAFKSKRSSAMRGKWIFAPFTNSARNDNAVFYHWVKADIQYADYPYAKFNLSLDPIIFTEEEYTNLLSSKSWTKEETMHVLDLASKYSLRWPVITDRYDLEPYRSQEEIQARYYTVLSRLRDHRVGITSSANDFAKDDHQLVFNLEQEKRRKYQLELAYRKTREEEQEEQQLREELKCIDLLLKKAKKVVSELLNLPLLCLLIHACCRPNPRQVLQLLAIQPRRRRRRV
jgi:DNA methyltransferase 1-associated protein 1